MTTSDPGRIKRFAITVMPALIAAVVLSAVSGAGAQCQGSGCLPGGGYSYDRHWNCGLIYGQIQSCFYPGVLGRPSGQTHTWGWGSADYDGGGTVRVGLDASTPSQSSSAVSVTT